MGFKETLALIVDADTRGAVSNVEKLGTASERELGRSEKSLDKWGNRLTSVGAGMVAFGATALFGMGKAAMAAEDAQLSTVKLENTIQRMPKLAGENSQQFIDLAESIQDVTAADADAIVEGQALLGTFNLTADQIKGITPLIVDYARKFGTDIPSAAIQVGKALDGSIGALKKNGVSIDEVLYKTDRYAAVQEALANQVGGFAEAEGKTFAGSLQRLKNQLGDIVEGVGVGAVDAFTTLGGAAEAVADRLNSLSPETQSLIGKVATFGAVGLIAAGGLSTVIGQAIKARENFSTLAEGVSGLTEKMGGASRAAGILAGAAAIGGVLVALHEMGQAAKAAEIDKLTDDFMATGDAADLFAAALEGDMFAIGDVDKVFNNLLETNIEGAKRFVEGAEAAGLQADYIKALRARIEEKSAVDQQAAVDQEANAEAIRDGTDAMGENTQATEDNLSALQQWADAQKAMFDPLFAFQDAMLSSAEAAGKVTEAELKVAAAEADVATARKEHGASSEEATEAALNLIEAQNDLEDAYRDAVGAALDYDGALADLKQSMVDGNTPIAEVKATIDRWARSGRISAETAAFYKREVDKLAGSIRQTPDKKATTVSVINAAQAREEMRRVREASDRVPRNVNIHVSVSGRTATELLAGYGALPGRAHGGDVGPGWVGWVGEEGPELLVMQGGGAGHVYTKDQVRSVGGTGSAGGFMGGGNTYINNFDFRGALLPNTADVERAVGKMVDGAMRNGYITSVASR